MARAATAQREKPEAFAKRPDTIGNVEVSKPQTGKEYLESLNDGREVYIYGERVKDVTTHPAFRNTVAHGRAPLRRAAQPEASATRSWCRPRPATAA